MLFFSLGEFSSPMICGLPFFEFNFFVFNLKLMGLAPSGCPGRIFVLQKSSATFSQFPGSATTAQMTDLTL